MCGSVLNNFIDHFAYLSPFVAFGNNNKQQYFNTQMGQGFLDIVIYL